MSEIKVAQIRFKEFSEEWEEKKLKDVSTYFNGGSFENNVKEKGKYKLVTLKSINMSGKLINSGKYIDIETSTLKKDTLVMILSEQSKGLIGMTSIIPKDYTYVLNQRVAEIRPFQDIDSYFLSMLINKNQEYFSHRGAGTKVQNISKPNVENFNFFCPLLNEQTKIGSYFQNLDKLIEQKEKKQQKLKQLKKAMLSKMFPKEGEDVPEIRFDGFSGVWEEKELINICCFVNETISISKLIPNKYISTENLLQDFLGVKISSKLPNLNNVTYFKKNDILISNIRPYLKKVWSAIFDGGASNDVIVLRANEDINYSYLTYLIKNEKFINYVMKGAKGVKMPRGDISLIKKYPLVISVNINEQTKIGNYFQKLDKLIDLQQKELEKLKNIKKASLDKMFV